MKCDIGTDTGTAKQWLENGFAVGIPTETVYGLAADATDPAAVTKVFSIKNRPVFDPLIVHVSGKEQVAQIAELTPEAELLMDKFWPGPLTFLLKKKSVIPDLVTSGLDSVGVRMPDQPLTLQLLRSLTFPLAAPSANPFGYISPTTAQHVADQLGDRIPYILDGGPCRVGVESTIIAVNGRQVRLYRQGGITEEALKSAGYEVDIIRGEKTLPAAPGMLESHYAPDKSLIFGTASALLSMDHPVNTAVICFQKPPGTFSEHLHFYELSPEGDLEAAAAQLFSVMRLLDNSNVQRILAVEFPEMGLGKAINDRLRRAGAQRPLKATE